MPSPKSPTRIEELVDLDATLAAALEAADEVCAILVQGQSQLTEGMVKTKSPGDVTTIIDRQAEDAIHDHLQARFPEFAFTGEEGGTSGHSRCRWIVDPLDGTMNQIKYSRKLWASALCPLRATVSAETRAWQ